MSSFVVIETTFSQLEEAHAMASLLVEQKRCACCQFMSITSCFHYEGSLVKADEALLRCKTTKQAQKAAIECILKHHSYSVPEIVVYEVSCPSKSYASWIEDLVKPGDFSL
jgi:periplasmic divalent cation tolerance protein